MMTFENLIDGSWMPAETGAPWTCCRPVTASPSRASLAAVQPSGRSGARRARPSRKAHGAVDAVERGRLMIDRQKILDHFEELAQARDTGKPMKQARADIRGCALSSTAAPDKFHGDVIPFLDGYLVTEARVEA